MYKVVTKKRLCPVVDFMEIGAPAVAKKAKAGQFIDIRVDEVGERILLTLSDWDNKEGNVTLEAMQVETNTYKLITW